MIGVGGLWLRVDPARLRALYGADCEGALTTIADQNLRYFTRKLDAGHDWDARHWLPYAKKKVKVDLVFFSPPFRQNHSCGKTASQQEIRDRNHLHSMQNFGNNQANLARLVKTPARFWAAMVEVYGMAREMMKKDGTMVVILRNFVKNGQEVDDIFNHIMCMRLAGLDPVGAHPREVPTTKYIQMQWAYRKVELEDRIWIDLETAVVATR
jgi:tRNA1(Val) A37 N6-methylase TrmN6